MSPPQKGSLFSRVGGVVGKARQTPSVWIALALFVPLLVFVPGMKGFPYPNAEAPYSDAAIAHYPKALYFQRALAQGRWPLWSPQILSGAPFAANPLAGVWYPPHWLALAFPLPLGLNILAFLHLWWGGVGVAWLLRRQGFHPSVALWAGWGFELLPKSFAHFGAGHLSLIYSVAWTPWLLLAAQWRRERRYDWGEALVLALTFLADPRWSLYAGLLWAAEQFARSPWREWGSAFLTLGKQVLAGACLAAPLALPLWEFTRLSNRAAMTAQEVMVHSLPLPRVLGLFYADWGGFHEYMLYGGQGVVALALAAAVGLRRKWVTFWGAVVLAALAWALAASSPLLFWAARLPLVRWQRVPTRALFLCGLGLILLAAPLVDEFLRDGLSGAAQRRVRLALLGLMAFSLLLGLVLIQNDRAGRGEYAWSIVLLILIGVLIYGRVQQRFSPRGWLLALSALCFFDWLVMDLTLFTYRPVSQVLGEGSEVAAYLKNQGGRFRVYSPSYSLPQQTAAFYDLELAEGVDPLQLKAYVAYMEKASGVPMQGYSVTLPPFAHGDPLHDNVSFRPWPEGLGRLAVAYVVSAFDLSQEGLVLERRFGEVRLYRNLEVKPRAWTEPEARAVVVRVWEAERIVLEVEGPGRLILAEVVYPGWQVWVDGVKKTVEVEHGILRAVTLPAGQHRVEFLFRPWSIYAGVLVSALTLAFLVARMLKRRSIEGGIADQDLERKTAW